VASEEKTADNSWHPSLHAPPAGNSGINLPQEDPAGTAAGRGLIIPIHKIRHLMMWLAPAD